MGKTYPFYIRSTVILLGLVLLSYILFHLGDVFVPLAFAIMLAMLLNPIVIFLQGKLHFPQILAIVVAILLSMLIVAAVSWLLFIEIRSFGDQIPLFKKKMAEMGVRLQGAIARDLNISVKKQQGYIDQAETALKPVLTSTAGTMLGGISLVILLPVYTFLFLYYKKLILNFLYEIFAEKDAGEVGKVLTQTKGAIQQYMYGLVLEALIVATLNSIALLILGVKYAILLGVIGALLNVLPFIGGILAVVLPILIATLTMDGIHTQIEIIIAYIVIQFIDNHFLVPYIVSSKVKINALISIVIVLLGGSLWGIAGMFLSIPFIGVMKIIFDRIPEMKPWGKLLGTEVPTDHKGQLGQIGRKLVDPIKRTLRKKPGA